jgi:hypothetical protein
VSTGTGRLSRSPASPVSAYATGRPLRRTTRQTSASAISGGSSSKTFLADPRLPPRGVGRCSCQRRTEARMYVRVARFEGVDPSRTDAMVEAMRGQMDAMRRGETPEGIPAEAVAALRDDITRGMSLLDREHDVSLFLAFADDEAAIRRVDAALNAMSPGRGRRRPDRGGNLRGAARRVALIPRRHQEARSATVRPQACRAEASRLACRRRRSRRPSCPGRGFPADGVGAHARAIRYRYSFSSL